jgi:hypothetical protein
MINTTVCEGLTVHYDDGDENKEVSLTFEWDEETHPQYNFIYGMTSEQLISLLLERAKAVLDETNND